jgi:hypothetical protein
VEFIALLKRLDEHYPQEAIIRVVLDNHSAHTSKETTAYLAPRPGRFEDVTLNVNSNNTYIARMMMTILKGYDGMTL